MVRSRNRLEQANRRVAECEGLVSGWRGVLHRQEAEGKDDDVGRQMLKIFGDDLEAAIIEQGHAEKLVNKRVRDFFMGAKGRLPYTDDELDAWLASAEGKAAMAFEPVPLPASMESKRRS